MTDMGSVPDWIAVALTVTGGAGALARRRSERVRQFRELVEEASGLAAAEILPRLEDHPDLEEIVTRAIGIAAVTARAEKREILARVIAAGLADDAVIDETLLLVRMIDAIDPPHLQVLLVLRDLAAPAEAYKIRAKLPGQPEITHVLLAHLEREGLAMSGNDGTWGSLGTVQWSISRHGRQLLTFLR